MLFGRTLLSLISCPFKLDHDFVGVHLDVTPITRQIQARGKRVLVCKHFNVTKMPPAPEKKPKNRKAKTVKKKKKSKKEKRRSKEHKSTAGEILWSTI